MADLEHNTQIIIESNGDELRVIPFDYQINYDSLAAQDSGRTADGVMHLNWILTKITKLTVKLPPHKWNDRKYSGILSFVQGQTFYVTYWDYLAHEEKRELMYCSKTNASWTYLDYVMDAGFELTAIAGLNTRPPHVVFEDVTVTWKNWDGTTLETDTVPSGDTPVYSGATPTRPTTAQYSYTFTGWLPAVGPVRASQTYTAQYTSTPVPYMITVTAGANGSATGGGTYGYGTTATLTATPDSGYRFVSWNDGNTQNPRTITVTGNASYSCTFEVIPPPPSEYWELDWMDDFTFENDDESQGPIWDVKGTSCPMYFISNNQNYTSISVDEYGEYISYNSTDVWEGSGESRQWNYISSNYKTMRFYSDPEYLFEADWTDFLFNNLDGSIRHFVNGVQVN